MCLCVSALATVREREQCRVRRRFPDYLMPRRPTSLVTPRSAPRTVVVPRVPKPAVGTPRQTAPVREKQGRSWFGRLLKIGVFLTIWGFVTLVAIVIWAAYDLPR